MEARSNVIQFGLNGRKAVDLEVTQAWWRCSAAGPEWCATLPFRERLGPRSEGWAVIVRHLLRLEIDAQRGAFDLAGEFDILFVAANCGIARRSFLGEE